MVIVMIYGDVTSFKFLNALLFYYTSVVRSYVDHMSQCKLTENYLWTRQSFENVPL